MVGVDGETGRVEFLFADPDAAARFVSSRPDLPGLESLRLESGGPADPTRPVFEIEIRCEDRERLLEAAGRVEDDLAGRPGVRSVEASDLDRRASCRLSLRPDAPVTASDVAARIRQSTEPIVVSKAEPVVFLRSAGTGPTGRLVRPSKASRGRASPSLAILLAILVLCGALGPVKLGTRLDGDQAPQ